MEKGGFEPTETELSFYNAGKRRRKAALPKEYFDEGVGNTIKDIVNE